MSNQDALVEIQIFGRNYTVRGGTEKDYIENLAAYVDRKMNEVSKGTGESRFGDVAALTCLNIADEFAKSKQENRKNSEVISSRLSDVLNKIDKKLEQE